MDNDEVTGLVFIDFRKAFDVINHELLLKKLSIYGASPPSVAWFQSYLSQRKQFITLGKTTSEQLTIRQGVPQGSILGPVLFLLFVNDMPLKVHKSTMDIYADDTNLSLSSDWKAIPALNKSLTKDLTEVEKWANESKMFINTKKTKALLATGKRLRRRIAHDTGKFEARMQNAEIEQVGSHKLLGVIIDEDLTYEAHVDELCNKLSKRIGLLRHISCYLKKNQKLIYYNAVIKPLFMTYCTPLLEKLPSLIYQTDVSEDDEYPYEMLKNEISAGRGFLKTAHINVNGILTKSKLDEIRLLLRTTGLDILGITESKLTNDVKDEDLDIAGYKFIRRDRPCEDGGGGCLLYYMEDMHLTENPRFLPHDIDNLEAIWVDILFHSQRLALSVMYRPPKDMSFYDTLDKQLQYDTRSLIDLSISSNKSKIKKAGTFDTGIADHRLNYCVLHLFRKRSPAKLKTVVDWKHCDIKNFKDSLALVPWHTCNIFDDIDDNYWLAESLYKDLSKEFLKTRKAKIRDKSLPWMNSDIRKLMNKRYKLLVKAQASNKPGTVTESSETKITPSTGDLPSLSDKIFQVKFNTINTQKSHGADNMSAKEMKIVGDEFSPCIANLSRLSYWSGSYPSQWKIGKVKVLWKSGNKEDCSNYRPITLLSIPSKITESVICDNIDSHLKTVLQKNHWGYRKGVSTESLLLYLSETWKINIDCGKVIGVIFIDFRKAFDSVDHDILFYKMQACGIYGNLLRW
ncbi:hypothetical protein ACROYT_G018519 [Oculina patagonica]